MILYLDIVFWSLAFIMILFYLWRLIDSMKQLKNPEATEQYRPKISGFMKNFGYKIPVILTIFCWAWIFIL